MPQGLALIANRTNTAALTGEVAAASRVNILLPGTVQLLTLPRDVIVTLVRDVIRTQVTDLQALEVRREILERHPKQV